jgi:hypothetical protein
MDAIGRHADEVPVATGFGHDPAPVSPHNALFPSYKTARVHLASRRRGGVAARGARGADSGINWSRICRPPDAIRHRSNAVESGGSVGECGETANQFNALFGKYLICCRNSERRFSPTNLGVRSLNLFGRASPRT